MSAKNVANISLHLSLLSLDGALFNVKNTEPSREVKLSMVCPLCNNSLLDQLYVCQAGCQPDDKTPAEHAQGWTVKEVPNRVRVEGRGQNQKLIPVSAEEIAEARQGTLPAGWLELAIYPAGAVEKATWTGTASYHFEPSQITPVFTMLLRAVEDETQAFVGVLNLRGNERLYRLVAHEGTLRLVELLRPEETQRFDAPEAPEPAEKDARTFQMIVSAMLDENFDPEMYASTKLRGLKKLLEAKASGATISPITKTSKPADDLSDALAQALAIARANKEAKPA